MNIEEKKQKQGKKMESHLLVGYICEVSLFVLIIIYCVLSPSLFSTIAMWFMMLAFAFSIASPHYIQLKPQRLLENGSQIPVHSYPVSTIIWGTFILINLVILVFKTYIIATQKQGSFTQQQQQFYQIQSPLYMFLPCLLFPFAIGALLIKPSSKKLKSYSKKLSTNIPTPCYLLLSILIIMIQIFSISFIGLVYFFIIIGLFVQSSTTFDNIFYRILVSIIQLMNLIVIPISFLVTTSYLSNTSFSQYYQTVGIDSLLSFLNSQQNRGHIITEILIFMFCSLLQRFFEYEKMNNLAIKYINDVSIAQSQLFGQKMDEEQEQIQIEKNDEDLEISERKRSTQQRARQYSLKQYELQSLYSRSHSNVPQQKSLMRRAQTLSNDNKNPSNNGKGELLKFGGNKQRRQRPSSSKIKQQQNHIQTHNKKVKKTKFHKLVNKFLNGLNLVIKFLNSSDFTLRVIEIISIIVIQRYNNVYSFIAVLWLALVASVQNLKAILIATAFVLLPLQFANYVIMYLYNCPPQSFLSSLSIYQIWGFQKMQQFWLDIIIFNVYIYYIILFIIAALKDTRRSLYSRSSTKSEPTAFVMILAFCYRYTYLLTLGAIFFLGFSTITLINLAYVIIFLIFFTFGQNVHALKKQRHGKTKVMLTTFSRKFWFIIVYYTLGVIVAKYIYFLFFSTSDSVLLEPIGLNQLYNWSFNFSLSSICLSNTTPFFIIFILAQIQILVYRSSIYINYSFSLIATSNSNRSKNIKPGNTSARIKLFFRKALLFCLQFYYQGLYYISGIIILVCSYQWNMIQLPIIIMTCIGLLKGFNKGILAAIVFLDLTMILLNYCFRFLNYEEVTILLGDNLTTILKQIGMFIGYDLSPSVQLHGIFALSLVIFYFSVECYRIQKLLTQQIVSVIRPSEIQNQNDNDDPLSLYQPTIIDTEYQQQSFAHNYKSGVIEATKRYCNTQLFKKYSWLRYFCKVLSIIIVDAVAIVVLISCLYFRLSVSMFLFLVIYLVFYYLLFDNVGQLFIDQDYPGRIDRQIQEFNNKEKLILQKQNPQKMITDYENLQNLKSFMKTMYKDVLLLKCAWKQKIWVFSCILSATCLVLTYTAQFIVSDFYVTYIHLSSTNTIQNVLFIIGISMDTNISYFNQIYFYYFMVMINVVQKLLIKFIELDKNIKIQYNIAQDIKQISHIDNTQHLIHKYISDDFIEECEFYQGQKLHLFDQEEIGNDQLIIQDDDNDMQIALTSNILIYFGYKKTNTQINLLYGLLTAMVRTYLWLMLINVYEKSNIFAFAYMAAVFYFWFKKIEFSIVKDINKAAIVILLLQYFMLLLDIDPNSSPLPLPVGTSSLSLLQKYINDQQWLDFLVINQSQSISGTILFSFLINSIIIFVTQVYFAFFQSISKLCVQLIQKVYERYYYIFRTVTVMKKGDTVYLNYANYKDISYRALLFVYQVFIVNSYIFVSILILMLLSSIHTYLSLILLILAFAYIYLSIFTRLSEDKEIIQYTKLYFQLFRILLFILLIISIIVNIPVIQSYVKNIPGKIGVVIDISEIFLILFIQMWLDLSSSQQFDIITRNQIRKVKNRELVLLKCMAYQSNNYSVRSLIQSYNQILKFQVNIQEAMRIIKEWHSIMNKNSKIIQLNVQKQGHNQTNIQLLRQKMKEDLAKRPQEDFDDLDIKVLLFLQRNTNHSLQYKYYELMQYIVKNNHRVLEKDQCFIDIWDYILEDYQKLEDQILKSDQILFGIAQEVNAEDKGFRMTKLQQIKFNKFAGEQLNVDDQRTGDIKTPKKIFLDTKPPQKQLKNIIWFWTLSNFTYILSFMLWIYYMINPCLLSLPIIVYLFSYEIIANKKMTSIVLLYIFVIIVLSQLLQLQLFQFSIYTQYFFFQNDDGSYNFATGYLYFVFILIFINEEINKYKGIKFRNQCQIQNLQTAALRLLVNQDQKSDLYLWKMMVDNQQDYEKDSNPMQYFSNKIQNTPQDLVTQKVPSFIQSFYESKIGIDVYPLIATVQIFLTIFLIFFYPLMTVRNSLGVEQSLKYSSFSSSMVLGILAHVFVIVVQRKITLIKSQNQYKQLIKYVFTMIVFILFLLFIYDIAPFNPPHQYSPPGSLVAFSFFYFIYFFLSGLQIKYGYKKYKSLNSIMTRRRQTNNLILTIYTAIPFLYELKCIMDWSFVSTSLKIFDWFRLFQIYLSAFKAKIQYYNSTGTQLGKPLNSLMKIMGYAGFIILLLIIFGPMILFSGLNPTAQSNLVIGGSLQLGIQIAGGNYFSLYTTSHFSQPPLTYNSSLFNNMGFQNVPQLQQMTPSDIPKQFQGITFQPFSDDLWGISPPNYDFLIQELNDTINQMENNQVPNKDFQVSAKYILTREISDTIPTQTGFSYPLSGEPLNITLLKSLYSTITTCNSSTVLQNFYSSLILLATTGKTYKPRPIFYTNPDGIQPYMYNVNLTMYCTDKMASDKIDTNNVYWSIDVTQLTTNSSIPIGVQLYVYCDLYQSLIGGLSFTALYTSVILVIAGFVRGLLAGNLPLIPYELNPKPDNILQICQAIGTLRQRKNYRDQYLMFYELIDIIRSPEIMKYMSGSYPVLIAQQYQIRKKREKQKEQRQKKKNM